MCIWRWHVLAACSTVKLFAQFKTTKSHENYVFLYPFSNMAISPQNYDFFIFYTAKLYGLTGMPLFLLICTVVVVLIVSG